jgi:phenylacetic acid degradation operon negative regulatory protein
MDSLATLSDLEALAMRLLLIYEFRRCCLAHPPLPLDAASGGSREERARAIASRLWRALLGPSERWLNRHGRRHDGNLPAASRELSLRFLT